MRALATSLVLALSACSSAPAGPPPGPSAQARVDGCRAGTMPTADAAKCLPVGPSACGEGFEPAASGWGCAAVVPPDTCEGATRASLGSRTCKPLGDCARAFPPEDADVVVDPSASASDRVVHTLAEAIARAPSGGHIALAKGTHVGKARVTKDLVIEGHCTDEVVVQAIDEMDAIYIGGGASLTLSSLTLSRRDGVTAASTNEAIAGVVVGSGKLVGRALYFRDLDAGINAGGPNVEVTLEGSVMDGFDRKERRYTSGVSLLDRSRARLHDVEIRGYVNAASAMDGAALEIERSVLRYDGTLRDQSLISVHAGATLSFVDGLLVTRASPHVFASPEPANGTGTPPSARVTMRGSVLEHRGVALDQTLVILDDSPADIRELTVVHRSTGAFWFRRPRAASSLENVVVSVADPEGDALHHRALSVSEGADVKAERLAILDPVQLGAFVDGKGSRLQLSNGFVRGTRFGVHGGKTPWGFGAAAIEAMERATLDIADTTLENNVQFGVLAGGEVTIGLRGAFISGTTASPGGKWGEAIFADGGSRVSIEDSVIRSSADAAVCFGGNSYGVVARTTIERNGVGVASELAPIVESAGPAVAKKIVVESSTFLDNGERFRFAPLEWSLSVDAASK